MPFILVLLFSSINIFAQTEANCSLTSGIYKNTNRVIEQIRFETIVDIFSINNAHTLSFDLEGEHWRFQRKNLSIKENTYLIYASDKGALPRAAFVMLEGQPGEIFKNKEFRGNLLLTPEMKNADVLQIAMKRKDLLTYNFVCHF